MEEKQDVGQNGDLNEDLRMPKKQSEQTEGDQKEPPTPKGILKTGPDAKYSETDPQEAAAKRGQRQETLKAEEQKIIEDALQYYLRTMRQQAEDGHVVKTIRSLEITLNDKMRVFSAQPKHPSLWLITKVLSDIALKHAVKNLNIRQFDTAFNWMKSVQKYTEPLAGSDWSKNPEWILIRKNLHKNFAIYHQQKTMWQPAFDNLKLALRLERLLGLEQEATNTSLTCSIIQQKMKNYGMSIDYSQQTIKSIEKDLKIKKGEAITDARYNGKDLDKIQFNDKAFTQYAIALHIVGKNLLNLGFFKEAKHFITKAHYVVTKMILKDKKTDLQLAIQIDMRTVLEKTRYLADIEAEDGAQITGNKKKKSLKKETALTDEDIERSLAAIKSGLATVSDGQDSVVERFNAIGQELKQLENNGEIEYKEMEEEFKDIFQDEDGAKIITKDEELEDQIKDVKKRIGDTAEPDAREQTPATVKKQAKIKKEDAADKRETDPEYLAKLEDFKRAQEALRLKQENFQRRQKEYEERKAQKILKKDAQQRQLKEQQRNFLEQRAKKTGKVDHLAKQKQEMKEKQAAEAQSRTGRVNKLQRYKSEQRTKQAPLNLARIGAQRDLKGLSHVGEKGTKAFFQQRKRNMLSLNRNQYQSQGDEIKLEVDEYNELQNEQDGGDRPVQEEEKEEPTHLKKKKVPTLPAISMAIRQKDGSENKTIPYSESQKQISGRKGPASSRDLFKNGLKSSKFVVEKAKDAVMKPLLAEAAKKDAKQDAKTGAGAKDDPNVIYKDETKLNDLKIKERKLRKNLKNEDELMNSSEEERQRIAFDQLSDGGNPDYVIGEKSKEILAKDDRNYLVRQKTHEQLAAEDPANRKIWGYDENDNKVLLKDDDGNYINPNQDIPQDGEEPAEDDDGIDTMGGIQNLTTKMKDKADLENKEKEELGSKLLETELEAKNRKIAEAEQKEAEAKEELMKKMSLFDDEDQKKKSIMKEKKGAQSPKKKKKVRLEVSYDHRGTEKRKEILPSANRRGRQRGQGQSQAPAGGSESEVGPDGKPKYTAPTTMKGRRLKREQEEKIRNSSEQLEQKLANEKHTVKSYYDLDAPATQNLGKTGLRNPDAKTLDQLGQVNFDKERVESLAAPLDRAKQIAIINLKKQKDEKLGLFDKQVQIAEKLGKKNKIDFEDYIDRDVPPIRGDTGEFSKTRQTSKGLQEFEHKNTNKLGLFAALAREAPGDTYAVQNAKEKMAKLAVTDGSYGHKELRMTDDHLPQYMKVARQAQLERGAPGGTRMAAYRKAMNDNVVQKLGLKNHIPFEQPQYINLKDLRELEHRSARQIQALARCFFTRKWYLNYIVRKKLGVPFSGLEFAQNPFLRQFAKPNISLNRMQQIDESNMLYAVPSSADLKLSTAAIKRLRNRQQEYMIRIKGKTRMPDNTDGTRLIAKGMRKGMSPSKIIQNLQDDFLANGLEAYDQFKRLNVGIDHDANGEAMKRVTEDGVEIIEPIIDAETKAANANIYGSFQLPTWLGDKTDKEGGRRGGIIDTTESETYINRKKTESQAKAKAKEAGPSAASMLNFIKTNEGKPGRGPDDGGGGGGSDGPGGYDGGDENDIKAQLRRARDPDGEDDFFQPQRYQAFSREPIVFYKRVINDRKMIRWAIRAGEAFKRKGRKGLKYFIPITLLGQVLGSHQLVYYKMNLELIKISDSYENHLENFKFETIWPFILYLFNYWVKNQATLMIQSQTHPYKRIYQAELARINDNQNYIEFFHENAAFKQELEQLEQLDNLQLMASNEQKQGPKGMMQKGSQFPSNKASKAQYDNLLDFSSEIEFDERFDQQQFMIDNLGVGTVRDGQHRIDRSKPEQARANTKVQREENRKALFEEYKRSVEEYEKAKKKVTFDQEVLGAAAENDPELQKREEQKEKEAQAAVEKEKYMINIKDFINEKFLYLPTNQHTSAYKLLKTLQAGAYNEVEKAGGSNPKSLALLNEERRRRLKLSPLTPIDYNCMERAAQKLKLIVDCLMLSRRISGYALIPKDVVIAQMLKQQEQRHLRHQNNAKRANRTSHLIFQQWGMHVEIENQFNPESAQVQQSIAKIKEYQRSNMITNDVFTDGPADGVTDVIRTELQIDDGQEPRTEEFHQDQAITDQLTGINKKSKLERNVFEYDPVAARHRRVANEFENYIEDKCIIDQQAVRLPESTTGGTTSIFIQTIYARKIKSNIENILQILWEREAETKKGAELEKLIFTGDRDIDNVLPDSGDEGGAPSGSASAKKKSEARLANEEHRRNLLVKAPKIERLQSRVCKILSDHEDVQDYDLEQYPPGTDKISKFIVLDVEQEKLQKQRTVYKSYAEIQICSSINLKQMWDDSVNVPWETLIQFFSIFGIKWDPVTFMKRGGFKKEESFLINEYFSRCFFLDHNDVQALSLDLGRLGFNQIKYDEIFLKMPENVNQDGPVVDEFTGEVLEIQSNVPVRYSRKLFEKYIRNEEYITRFDDAEYDKLTFPFYDESEAAFTKLFQFDRRDEFKDWIEKFKDPNEQKDAGSFGNGIIGAMGTTVPIYMVEETTLNLIKSDATHMLNLTLSKFNQRQDDLLYLGRLHLASVIKWTKIEPVLHKYKAPYNVKIEYYVKGTIPVVLIKCFDTYTMEVLSLQTINKKHIKMIIRMCHQQSDKMITNQLESLIQINSSKLTVGRSIFLNFNRKQLQQKNLGQNFVNMLICYESLLQKFISNQVAAKNQNFNNGVKQFKGLLRHIGEGIGSSSTFLVSINQYDMFVETLLYFNPMSMIHGNRHLNKDRIKEEVLLPIQRKNEKAKSFDRVKVWKINLLDMQCGKQYDCILSLHDIVHFYESELPQIIDLENEVRLPNLIDLLHDYFEMMVVSRSILGNVILWRLPQYKKPVDPVTGRMQRLNPDELYRMKILDIYKEMLKNIQSQMAFDDNNALPLSLDAQKKNPDKNKQQLPKLCLRCKTIREKQMPIFDNNSKQILKVVSADMVVVVQRPKIFTGALRKLQFAMITVIQHPRMECWIWQIYFPRNQRTFTCTLYASDLFSMDDEVLNDEYIMNSENVDQALWAHLINLSKLVKNQIGDIMIVVQNFKEPLKEILFQDVVYNQNAKDMMFMEVVLKNYANFVTDVESPFPAIQLLSQEVRQYTFAVRAFSLTRNVWIKDFQPFFEVIAMLKREKYYVNDLEFFYYSMLKDTACLLSHKIIFSEDAKTQEVKKRKLLYDIKSIIARKAIFREVSQSIEISGSPKKEAKIEQYLDEANKAVLLQEEHEQTELTKMNKIRNRPDWDNVERLNQIVFQAIVSSNPVQMCTIIYIEVKDVFVYRLYRAQDSSIFERQISANDVARTCAPHLRAMLRQGLRHEVGQRIAQHYMANVLVASVLDFHKIR